jgi:hypothetical protein
MKSSKEWLVPLTGIVFVVVAIVAFAIGGEPPEAKEGGREIIEHYSYNKDSIQIGAALATIAAAVFVFFFGYVRKVLRAAEGEGGMLSAVALVGAAIAATGIAIDAMIGFALAEAADDIDPVAAQAVEAIWDNDFFPRALGTVVVLLATGISVVRHGALPKWLGWVAVALGVLMLTPIGFFALPLGALWIVGVSILLALRARVAPSAPAPTNAAAVTG